MSDDLEWPREIWAAERGDFEPTGTHVFSVHATAARFEADTERDREFHRYVDSDIFDSQEKYFQHQITTLRTQLAEAREAALREAAYVAFNACLVPPDGGNPTKSEADVCEEAYRRILALIEGDKPRVDFEGFSRAIMNCWPIGDVDGLHLQDLAVKHGLLRMEPYDPEKHGEAEYDEEPGDEYYVFAYLPRPPHD